MQKDGMLACAIFMMALCPILAGLAYDGHQLGLMWGFIVVSIIDAIVLVFVYLEHGFKGIFQ